MFWLLCSRSSQSLSLLFISSNLVILENLFYPIMILIASNDRLFLLLAHLIILPQKFC